MKRLVMSVGIVLSFTVACGGGGDAAHDAPEAAPAANPCGGEAEANPCGGEAEANPCGGEAEANPCGGEEAANPCGGEEAANPCGEEAANPCGGDGAAVEKAAADPKPMAGPPKRARTKGKSGGVGSAPPK